MWGSTRCNRDILVGQGKIMSVSVLYISTSFAYNTFRWIHVLAWLQRQGAGWSPVQGPRLREQHGGGQAGEDVLLQIPLVQPPRLLLRGGGQPQGRRRRDGCGGRSARVKCMICGTISFYSEIQVKDVVKFHIHIQSRSWDDDSL